MTQDVTPTLLGPDEVARHRATIERLRQGLGRVILGQDALVDATITCLLSRGHLLLEGLPGLGKTELVKGLGRLLGLEFRRVQFTPDLMPSDITGSHVLETDTAGSRRFEFRAGPVFTNLLLADEINRASPKTQSALLEAMQERRVTLLGTTRDLPVPFFVLATQNPIELEGTYPLPEAQVDRFAFKLNVGSVGADVLAEIISHRPHGAPPVPEAVVDANGFRDLLDAVQRIFLPRPVAAYIANLVEASDPTRPASPDSVRNYVRYGASPRAAITMASASRAVALADGRPNVGFEDVKRIAAPVLRHRLLLRYEAQLDGITADSLVRELLVAVPELSREPNGVRR